MTSLASTPLTWSLVAVYGIGAVINGAAPPFVRREYARWGCRRGFTGSPPGRKW